MDFSFSRDQLLFQDNVRSFLINEVTTERIRELWQSDNGRSDQLWAQLVELGLTALTVPEAQLVPGRGLTGDRYSRLEGARQVTLIEAESLRTAAGYLGLDAVAADAVRRNLVTEGINLLALKGRRFRIGEAVLETTGECHPCSRMEEALGVGGYNALRGHGGITARVLQGGLVRIGDPVERLETNGEASASPAGRS